MKKRTITERENVLRVMTHSAAPEWVPITDDCIQTVVPNILRERPPMETDGDDWFGCSWLWDAKCFGFAPNLKRPYLLEDVADWREVVKFPDLDALDWETAAKADLADFDREEKLLRVFLESGPFERAHAFLGFSEAFMAMATEPEEFKALIDAIADYKVRLIDKVAEYYHPDDILFADDLASAKGPMISMDMYRELIKPAHKKIGSAMRARNILYSHHSCGRMEPFIDELMDNGMIMINPVQRSNDWKGLAARYEGRLAFNVDAAIKADFHGSTEAEIRLDVRDVIDAFAPHKNLVLFCFVNNTALLPQNRDIILDEARTYGADIYR